MKFLAQTIGHLIGCWVGDDRIRISPSQGRLLGLQLGDQVIIDRQMYRVASCQTFANQAVFEMIQPEFLTPDEAGQEASTRCQLVVPLSRDDDPQLPCGGGQMHQHGSVRWVFDDDVALINRDTGG